MQKYKLRTGKIINHRTPGSIFLTLQLKVATATSKTVHPHVIAFTLIAITAMR